MLVSVLIPAYNSEAFISETLQSCVAQTYPNVEIIVVDDESTDRTLEIALEWEKKYSNIHVYTQPNTGACAARNLALEKSRGEYVMFLDADDIINPCKIEVQMAELQKVSYDKSAIATCQWDRFYESIESASFPYQNTYKNYQQGIDLLLDLWNNSEMFGVSCYLISRELANKAGKWTVGLLKNQDGEFFSRVLAYATQVLFCPEGKLYYRTGGYSSISKDDSKSKVNAVLDSFIKYKETTLAREDSLRVKRALARNFSLYMYLYSNTYPDLCAIALSEIKSLGQKPLPVGSKRAKMISRIIGLENFLRLRKFIVKY